jgi:hypothetical protein
MRERYFMEVSSYRPRNSGHDYYGRGTYLVTLVVSGRERLLSRFVTNAGSKDLAGREHLELTPLGGLVQKAWQQIPDRQLAHGNMVMVLAPWDLDKMDSVNGIPQDSDYSRFHNLNTLAAEICAFDGEAKIIADKTS